MKPLLRITSLGNLEMMYDISHLLFAAVLDAFIRVQKLLASLLSPSQQPYRALEYCEIMRIGYSLSVLPKRSLEHSQVGQFLVEVLFC